MAPIPITILTGFLGSGKTTLLLNLLPQLPKTDPPYKLALLKNEFGDLAVDSQLALSGAIGSVRELLNGCICCNLVGDLGPVIKELVEGYGPSRIVIETSGSAFPATLAMEINRISRETSTIALDGVVSVIDVENWKGYSDTSYTAKVQAKFTDLIVFNKWEEAGERRMDEVMDRVGDLEGVVVSSVKSRRGWVDIGVVFGVDGGLAGGLLGEEEELDGGHEHMNGETHGHGHTHEKEKGHQSEVEVLSLTLSSQEPNSVINISALKILLKTAPKDEVYRIKAVITSSIPIPPSDPSDSIAATNGVVNGVEKETKPKRYILNWAFGRWTCTELVGEGDKSAGGEGVVARMTIILARYESKKWKRKIEAGGLVKVEGEGKGVLSVEKIV